MSKVSNDQSTLLKERANFHQETQGENQLQQQQKKQWSHDDFQRLNYISKGQFGMVWKMKELKSEKIVAVKQINKEDVIKQNMYTNLKREIEIQSHLMHKHIIECYGYYTTDLKVFIILEYAQKGSLSDLIKLKQLNFLSEQQIAKIIYQLATALSYLRERKVLHRDIKLENILIDYNGDVKLGDFGCSVIDFYQKGRSTFCGTVDYLSPEILSIKQQGVEADVWALGVVFYELLYQAPPFQGEDKLQKMNNIYDQKWSFLDNQRQISNQAKNLLLQLLNPDKEKRFKPHQIIESEYIKKYYDPSVQII
ncbi:Serine/Threonine kinase domain protein (macronuclear) [Tetrahymena thermophila SB210]|uniref:Serine/Threonine kinase domain protein n=1 Tax=Tetrahymena thermophila (strain SB210) TaxID=312017 RepID=I7MM37_TETTS|nr:Serine/Threonine kinase domain protein [Tetrahymena thermophila SB210]EAS03898.3 Serine/Threonine kinase domain protein [Tetrahymena thermophila SB210]|eukprot:XP_001024143.3 Serine/Threonine kinase domain protein [Tetrahymena thermophila SB210]